MANVSLPGALAYFEGAGRAADAKHLQQTLHNVTRLAHSARAAAACAHVLLHAARSQEDVAREALLDDRPFASLCRLIGAGDPEVAAPLAAVLEILTCHDKWRCANGTLRVKTWELSHCAALGARGPASRLCPAVASRSFLSGDEFVTFP